jgi:hypothetical protein
MEKEKQDVEKKLAEAYIDKENFEKLFKEEKEKAVPLPYLPMTRPPRPSSSATQAPRTSSAESHRHRRSSVDSAAYTIHIDMLQLPNGERGSGLTVIHEDVSGIASGSAPLPTWLTNPLIDYGKKDGGDISRAGTVSRRRRLFPLSACILLFFPLAQW